MEAAKAPIDPINTRPIVERMYSSLWNAVRRPQYLISLAADMA
jgi:hypothetical protein